MLKKIKEIMKNARIQGAIAGMVLMAIVLTPIVSASTITTINGSDTLTSSRTVINNNFSNLNNDKVELSNTSAWTALQKLFRNASTTQLSVFDGLYVGSYGGATTTIFANATSTFQKGINLSAGCFAIGGTCLTGSSGSTTEQTISQTSHGFTAGQWVGLIGTTTTNSVYALTNAIPGGVYESVGLVKQVVDSNSFILQTAGEFSDTNLVPGLTYFLEASTTPSGVMVGRSATTTGHISAPVAFAKSQTTAVINIGRPSIVPLSSASFGMNVGNDNIGSTYMSTSSMIADEAILSKNLADKRVRIALPSWDNPIGIYNMREYAKYYKSKGYYVSYGVTGLSGIQNSTTYASWLAQVPSEASWASSNGIDRFYIGNEEDWQAQIGSFGTVSGTTVRNDVRTLSSTLKSSYPSMEIVYSTAEGTVAQWGALYPDFGALDKLGFNMYNTVSGFDAGVAYFQSQIGSKFFVTEWGANHPYLDMIQNYGYDDAEYASDLATRYTVLNKRGVEAYFFTLRYSDNTVTTSNWNIYTNLNTFLPGASSAFGGGAGNAVRPTPIILQDNQKFYLNTVKTAYIDADSTDLRIVAPEYGHVKISDGVQISSTHAPQLSLRYDSSNRIDTTVFSNGVTDIETIGTNAGLFIKGTRSDSVLLGETDGAQTNCILGLTPTSDDLPRWCFRMTSTLTDLALDYRIRGSTGPANLLYFSRDGVAGIGTSTPALTARLTVSSTTNPQILLRGNATDNGWAFRSIGNNFYLASTSPTNGNATSTNPAFMITANGTTTVQALNILGGASGTTTSAVGFNISGGCYAIAGTCLGSAGGTVTSVGLSSSGSITVGSTPVTTSGTITANLNMANANTWTGLQSFSYSSTTYGSFTTASTTNLLMASSTYTNFGNIINPMRTGTSADRYYGAMSNGTALTNVTPVSGTMYALPMIISKAMYINASKFSNEGTGASSHARTGLYTDDGNMYPASLVVDCGEVDTSSGLGTKTSSCTPTLVQPGLYWIVWHNDGTSPVIRGYPNGSLLPLLGQPATIATAQGVAWSVSSSYGALPSTFPGGGAVLTATPFPAVFFRGI